MLKNRRLLIQTGITVAIIAIVITVIILIARKAGKEPEHMEPRVITLSIDAPADIPLEEKELIVYESLTRAGYSPAGVCGIMGSIAVESPDYDPAALNDASGALGLFQWTNDGDRQKNLKEFCRENAMNWNSIEAQLAFAVYELSGADPIACRLDEFLKKTDDPYTAAAEFTAGFERCITDLGKSADRYTGSLYPEFYGEHYQGLAKRINKAMNYYIRFEKNKEADDKRSEINITIE